MAAPATAGDRIVFTAAGDFGFIDLDEAGQGVLSALAPVGGRPVVLGYAPGCFRGVKRDAVPGMSINGGQASV
jgi:hypothetical protein